MSVGKPGQPGRRFDGPGRVPGLTQQTDRGPQVVERVAGGLDELLQALAGLLRPGVEEVGGDRGLRVGQGDLMGHQVVQFPGDAHPFLGHSPERLAVPALLGPPGPLLHGRQVGPSVPHRVAEHAGHQRERRHHSHPARVLPGEGPGRRNGGDQQCRGDERHGARRAPFGARGERVGVGGDQSRGHDERGQQEARGRHQRAARGRGRHGGQGHSAPQRQRGTGQHGDEVGDGGRRCRRAAVDLQHAAEQTEHERRRRERSSRHHVPRGIGPPPPVFVMAGSVPADGEPPLRRVQLGC